VDAAVLSFAAAQGFAQHLLLLHTAGLIATHEQPGLLEPK
jgi:hypothetical protein